MIMRKIFWLALVFSCCCLGGEAVSIGKPYVVNAEKHGQLFTVENGQIKVTANTAQHHSAQVYWRQAAAIDPGVNSEARLQIELSEPEAIAGISLHMRDEQKEFFQFKPLPHKFKSGLNELVFPLRDGLQRSSWGKAEVINKIIDPPYYPAGISVRFKPDSGKQSFVIHELTFNPAGKPEAETVREFIAFNSRGGLSSDDPQTRVTGTQTVTVETSSRKLYLRDTETSLKYYDSVAGFRVTMDADCSGTLWICGTASAGRKAEGKAGFAPGKNELNIVMENLNGEIFRFKHLLLELPGEGSKRITFVDSKVLQNCSKAEAIQFDVITGDELHILKGGEEKNLAVSLFNPAGISIAGEVKFDFTHFSGRHFTVNEKFDLSPGSEKRFPVSQEKLLGAWDVRAVITVDGNSITRHKSYAYLIPAGPTAPQKDGFLFGMCSHTHRWPLRDRQLEAEAAELCGVKLMRSTFTWPAVQPQPGAMDFSLTDSIYELYRGQGIEMLGGLGFVPRWAAPKELQNTADWRDWNRCMPPLDLWRKAVFAMVSHYQGKIRFWRVWNEPDFWSFARFGSDDYVKLVKSAYEELKKADPDAKFIVGDFATLVQMTGRPKDNVKFQRDALEGTRGYFDLHSHHEHGNFGKYSHVIDDLLIPMRQQTRTEVPWLAGETAIASTGGQEYFQAVTLYKKLIFSWARGAIAYLWYNLRNDGFDLYNGEHHYGMLTHDFYPKPVYSVYNMLARNFTGGEFVRQLPAPEGIWLFEFKRQGVTMLAGWNEIKSGMPVPIVIKTDASKVEKIDIMDNRSEVPLSGNTIIFELGEEPATLVLSLATYAEPAGKLLEIAPLPAAVPGRELLIGAVIHNPFEQAMKQQIRLILPEEFTAEKKVFDLTLSPGGSGRISFPVKVGDVPAVSGKKFKIELGYHVPGLKQEFIMPLVVRSAILIPPGDFSKRRPDFILDRQEQTVSRWSADPSKIHMLWQGPEDLSAKIWLGGGDDTIQIRAEVRDNRHCQNQAPEEMWRSDSIQFAFVFPEQQGMWVLGLARSAKGENQTASWSAPAGFDGSLATKSIQLKTSREGDLTIYEANISLKSLGIEFKTLRNGFQFNLLVNDDDSEGRKGWIHLAPGLGEAKNPELYPCIVY